ncbi:MAG: aminotransferase class I/II-fold pyridoxal phosphate-dependent enzyme [Clostridiales bacterium]|nr:aminotransferase class I/II-fold pyridoxal phosphate-dependent enzyme [Clostridiales bacterium]
MSNRLADHVSCVPPSGIRKFFDIVSEMKDAISLGVGEPDFVTPWAYSDAAIYSLRTGHTHYTSNWGLLELRRAINNYQMSRFGLEYNPEKEILVTVGASEGIDLALRAIINPGDEVLVPEPSYVSYAPGVTFSHGVCVPVPTGAENGFRITPDALRAAITDKTKALILPYPNNPTGAILSKEDLEGLAEVLRGTDIIVISDEIYAELTYEGTHHSIAALPGMRNNTIVLNGFSKAFAMTGWRMGWACAPADIMNCMFKIHQYTMLCAPTTGQYAALEALKVNAANGFADVQKMTRAYDRRRRFLVKSLNEMGLDCFTPLGAFYVFPSVSSTGLGSEKFCEELLYAQKVAAVPGTAFGQSGEGHVRMSYATSMEKIEEAVKRIAAFVEK